MNGNNVALPPDIDLNDWLISQGDPLFPSYSTSDGEKRYPNRYTDFVLAMNPYHNSVELGAMAAGAHEWMENTIKLIKGQENSDKSKELLDQLIQSDPIVYLNNHGHGHVSKVIAKASEMLRYFERGHLTPYEAFLLLCAIQLHDVGNFFGREDHEQNCSKILNEEGKTIIPDAFERKVIQKLALVHGGAYGDNKDTITLLSENKNLKDMKVRKRLLAALLRFADEIADDSSRANHKGLANNTILEGSRIYHRYSEALHTVKIDKNPNPQNGRIELNLSYEFSSDIAVQIFKKNGADKYLLDEIYDRTLKMERERRYCMRFLRPCFSLDAILVEIVIQSSNNSFDSIRYEYTLEEKGYPLFPSSGDIKDFSPAALSGGEEKKRIEREWGES